MKYLGYNSNRNNIIKYLRENFYEDTFYRY